MAITIELGYGRPDEVRQLFLAYTEQVISGDPTFREYLAQQNFEDELAHLEKKYGPPRGRLYLAYRDGVLAGCGALKEMDGENGELKRMYIRPAYRRAHIASVLLEKLLDDARSAGYRHLYLDTFSYLEGAVELYRKYGFYEIGRYNDSPMENAVYMRLDL